MDDDKLVDTYGAQKSHIAPCCNIQLQWIGPPGSELKQLLKRFEILGTTEPDCSFTISYNPGQYSISTTPTEDEQETSEQPPLDKPNPKLVRVH